MYVCAVVEYSCVRIQYYNMYAHCSIAAFAVESQTTGVVSLIRDKQFYRNSLTADQGFFF